MAPSLPLRTTSRKPRSPICATVLVANSSSSKHFQKSPRGRIFCGPQIDSGTVSDAFYSSDLQTSIYLGVVKNRGLLEQWPLLSRCKLLGLTVRAFQERRRDMEVPFRFHLIAIRVSSLSSSEFKCSFSRMFQP